MKSRMLALRHASSISSCVTSSAGFTAPRRILKRTVPAYNVYYQRGQHNHIYKTSYEDTYWFLRHQRDVFPVLRDVKLVDGLIVELKVVHQY